MSTRRLRQIYFSLLLSLFFLIFIHMFFSLSLVFSLSLSHSLVFSLSLFVSLSLFISLSLFFFYFFISISYISPLCPLHSILFKNYFTLYYFYLYLHFLCLYLFILSFLMGHRRLLFIFVFSNKHYNFYDKYL